VHTLTSLCYPRAYINQFVLPACIH